jgi:dihydrofolate reductase
MWSLTYWSDDIADFKQNELFSVDALLLGRVTYEAFATAWPGREDETGYADRINSMPKYVVSTTLQEGSWENSTIIRDNVAEEIEKLKQQPGQDILIFGSGDLTRRLMEEDLIDEYRLLVYPLVLGSGDRLFNEESKETLNLVESKVFGSNVVLLRYEPDRSEAE